MLIRLAIRNVFRNTRRSLLTAGMVTLGSALLCLSMAWIEGVFGDIIKLYTASSGHVRVVHPEYAQLERMMPLYANLADTKQLADKIDGIEDVRSVFPRTSVGVTITNTDEIGDHFALLIGAPIGLFEDEYRLNEQLLEGGRWFEAPDDILLGRKIAKKLGAEVGDEITMNGMTQDGTFSAVRGRLVGIVAGENPVQERQAFMSLERVQYLTDMEDASTEILVFGTSRYEAGGISSAIASDAAFGGLTVQRWSEREPLSGMIAMTDAINFIIMLIIIFITALGVWNTMTISVMERTGEIGVLRAMGLKRFPTVGLFILEGLIIGIIGGVLGVVLGGIPSYYLEVVGVAIGEDVIDGMDEGVPFSRVLRADLNGFVITLTFLTALSMAFVGSALPAIRATFIQPVEAMKARR